jgi:hypothetical protein
MLRPITEITLHGLPVYVVQGHGFDTWDQASTYRARLEELDEEANILAAAIRRSSRTMKHGY